MDTNTIKKEIVREPRSAMFKHGGWRKLLAKHRTLYITIFELFSIVFGYYLAFLVRFDFKIPDDQIKVFLTTLPFLIVARFIGYFIFKISSNSWLYPGMSDLMDIMKAAVTGSAVFIAMMVFIFRLEGYPRSVLLIEMLLNMTLIGGTKYTIRYIRENRRSGFPKKSKNALIVGAGRAGILTLNEIKASSDLGIQVVGFVDDDPGKKGMMIQGIPVRGSSEDIPALIKEYDVDEVIIAIPSAPYKKIMRIKNIAMKENVEIKVLPTLRKLLSGDLLSYNGQNVSFDELLGRRITTFKRESDFRLLEQEIRNKTVVVTGAGGSIGSELCKQIAEFKPRMLIMYERHECSLYNIEMKLKRDYPKIEILPVLGDILDREKLQDLFSCYKIDLIYHAAAYKHVPMMEREPFEAVKNNIIGTRNVAECAVEYDVEKFVLISTDKAVKPANVMGTTKRIAELIVQSLNNYNKTRFISVRFGNVIGSNGSVIPLFKKQIAQGGPITVTHPEVTRYFMSISEAVQLVMTAGAMGKGGEIFLLDMGEPIRIVDLAKELIKKSGLDPERDIDIVYTGLRPGEKLHEELYWQGEGIIPTENKKITMLKPNGRIGYQLFEQIDTLEKSVMNKDSSGVLKVLKELVPESNLYENGVLQASL